MRVARVDPAGRPLEGRRRQAVQAGGIVLGWVVLIAAIFWAARDAAAPAPWLIGTGVLAWVAAEHVAGRRGLVWPGSALAIVGPLSAGMGLSLLTPELRAAPAELRMAVIAGTGALLMALFLFRFRLPGLVSPVVTFTIVALFLGVYGADPVRLREVEGFSPRGILAAMLEAPLVAAAVLGLAAGAAGLARWLDLNGDDFGLAAARPLHVIGAGILALILGRWLALAPAPLDLAVLALAWGAAALWALRINRISVMLAAQLAMAKPAAVAVFALLGHSFSRADWAWLLPLIVAAGIALWPFLHEGALRRGWILGPGGRIPQPRPNWWWRYWPYA